MTIPPGIDGTPFIFFKPVLLSSFHLSLDPVNTDQSFTGFPIIFGLTLPSFLLSMLVYHWIIVYSLLVDVFFLYDGIGLLMDT